MVYEESTYDYVAKWTEKTQIKYVPHAKKGNTKSAERYEQYSQARTVGEALLLGAKAEDFLHDYQRKFIEVKRLKVEVFDSIEDQRQTHESFFSHFPPASAAALRARSDKTFKALTLAQALGVDLQDAQKLREGNETLEMTVGRLLADRTAQVVLEAVEKDGRRVTDCEVLSVLRLWMFKKNETRQNVLPEGQQWVHSDTFGLIRSRTGQYMVTNATREYPHVTQILNTWLHDRRPPQLDERFPCTSISLNSGYAAKRHRDGNNEGPSMIRGFGDYSGGQLAYWPDDDKSCPVENLVHEDRIPMDISKGLVLFDGNRGHEVDSFEGERFSVVWFSLGKFWKVQQEERDFLTHCGFTIPEGPDMGPISKLLPPPRGYTKCQSLGKMFGLKSADKAKVWQWPEEPNREEDKAAAKLLSAFNQQMETQVRGRRRGGVAAATAEPKGKPGPLAAAFGQASLGQTSADVGDEAEASPATPANMKDSTMADQAMSGEKRKRGRTQKRAVDAEEPEQKRVAHKALEPTSAEEATSSAEEPSCTAADAAAAEVASKLRATNGPEASNFSSLIFNPELAARTAAPVESFSLLAEALQAAANHPHPAVPLTNYFRFIAHHSASLETQLCDVLELLASATQVSSTMLRSAVKEAFGVTVPESDDVASAALRGCQQRTQAVSSQSPSVAAVVGMRASPSAKRIGDLLIALGSEGRSVVYLVLLLQGLTRVSRSTVLSALGHAFALIQPPCPQDGRVAQQRIYKSVEARHATMVAMERSITLAFGEVGGSSKQLVAALLRGCHASQLFAECSPRCGTPILPMNIQKSDDVELVLAKMASSAAVTMEPRHVGQVVQIHSKDNSLEIYGSDHRNLVGSLDKSQVKAVRSAVKTDCVIEAVLEENGNFVAVDCLVLNGEPLTRESLRNRKAAINKAVAPNDRLGVVHCEEVSMSDMTPETVRELLKEAKSQSWSGLALKSLTSEYEASAESTSSFSLVLSSSDAEGA
mmetsp:Transcript_133272/g.344889  ORF Transcript_133272/g.344889 Transcript_133272/m.344889 type:complete len:991 (+) Transcript_133272:80-3052(+)